MITADVKEEKRGMIRCLALWSMGERRGRYQKMKAKCTLFTLFGAGLVVLHSRRTMWPFAAIFGLLCVYVPHTS